MDLIGGDGNDPLDGGADTDVLDCLAGDDRYEPSTSDTRNGCEAPIGTGGAPAATVANGFAHSCVIRTDQTVACWGSGGDRELGLGVATIRLTPTTVPGLTGVTAVSAGHRNTCAPDDRDGAVLGIQPLRPGRRRLHGAQTPLPESGERSQRRGGRGRRR